MVIAMQMATWRQEMGVIYMTGHNMEWALLEHFSVHPSRVRELGEWILKLSENLW